MKSQSPCIGCKKWEHCFRLGAERMNKLCIKIKKWSARLEKYHERVGIS